MAAARALGGDEKSGPGGHLLGPLAFVAVVSAEHERIDRRTVPAQGVARTRGGDEHRGLACSLERARIPGRQINARRLAKTVPFEVVGSQWVQTAADRDDRALAAVLEQRHRPAARLRSPCHMHPHSLALELVHGRTTVCVVSQCGEEVDFAAEAGEDAGDHSATARSARECSLGMDHLAGSGQPRDRHEVHPLDVAHDG